MPQPTCPCCSEPMEISRTKTNKPYIHCDPCGVQAFVRGSGGIKKFTTRYGDAWLEKRPTSVEAPASGRPAAPAAEKPQGQASERRGSAPAVPKRGADIMEFD